MDEQALADNFENATWLDEQPNPDLNFIGLYALSELVREQGFRVILNGMDSRRFYGVANSMQVKDRMRSLEVIQSSCLISSANQINRLQFLKKSREGWNSRRSCSGEIRNMKRPG